MRFHVAVALLMCLATGVLADEPLCRVGKCEGGCDCGPRIKDCGCFRVAADLEQCVDTSAKPRGRGPSITIDDRSKKSVEKKPVMKTQCLCGNTGKCVCWASECVCPTCASFRAKPVPEVAVPVPFGQAAPVKLPSTGQVTTAQSAGGPQYRAVPVAIPNSVPVQYGAPTYTLTGSTGGITSGCANGQCGTVQRRGLFFR